MSFGGITFPLNFFTVFGALMGLVALLLVVQWGRETFGRFYYSHRGFLGKLALLVVAALSASLGAALVAVGLLISGYHAFTTDLRAAEVRARPVALPDGPAIDLVFTPYVEGARGVPMKFLLHGEEFSIEGDFLRWDKRLAFVGLHPGYRLTRVSGRYLLAIDEERRPRSGRAVGVEETDALWAWLYRYGNRLPLVEAAYGSSVYQLPDATKVYDVLVSPSGFSLSSHAP